MCSVSSILCRLCMVCILKRSAHAGSSQQHWPFPESHIGLGYAYILTHPGLPCVAWEHMWDPRHTFIITQLMTMRRRQDIHAGSKLEILCADRMMYVARIDNRWVKMRLRVHLLFQTESVNRSRVREVSLLPVAVSLLGICSISCECRTACTNCKCCTDVPCPEPTDIGSCLEDNKLNLKHG